MPLEKSAGVVIFRREGNELHYLLLHYGLGPARNASRSDVGGHWGFPKGHIEQGESLEQTALREAKEETGIEDIKFIEGFKEWIKYFYKQENKNIFKIVTYLLAETKTKEVKISYEHIGYKWLAYEQALEQLTFKNTKEILKKANKFLCKGLH